MRELIRAIRQSTNVQLVEDWYANFANKRNYEHQYLLEQDWTLTVAVRILKQDGVISRKEVCKEVEEMAHIIKEEPDQEIPKTERRCHEEEK